MPVEQMGKLAIALPALYCVLLDQRVRPFEGLRQEQRCVAVARPARPGALHLRVRALGLGVRPVRVAAFRPQANPATPALNCKRRRCIFPDSAECHPAAVGVAPRRRMGSRSAGRQLPQSPPEIFRTQSLRHGASFPRPRLRTIWSCGPMQWPRTFWSTRTGWPGRFKLRAVASR